MNHQKKMEEFIICQIYGGNVKCVDSNQELLQKRVRNLINGFASVGLSSKQTNNEDLRIILDNFLNGGQTTTFGTVLS